MFGHFWVKHVLAVLIAVGLTSAVTADVLAASSAQATSVIAASSSTAGSLVLNCSKQTQRALQYAIRHGYCSSGGVQPYNQTAGDCGTSFLYMGDAGGGVAWFYYGFSSSQGNVVYRSLNVSWRNANTGVSGGFGDSAWMNSSTYSNVRNNNTDSGNVSGSMTGWVQLWWGGQCTIIPPGDSTVVS
jgi:hypothetical protein